MLRGRDPLKLETWLPLYDAICKEFGFSKREDLACARLLRSLIGDRGRTALELARREFPETVLLCGGSDGLADELSSLVFDGYVVAADGATTVLIESALEIDMIVTDLDGIVEDQIDQNSGGSVVFLHAHGDNKEAVERHTKRFTGPVVGTCQCPPPPGLANFGGFTDGDRAACICAELGAKRILLAGFDFDTPSEKLGRRPEVKRKKLIWARRILDLLVEQGVKIDSVSSSSK